MMDAAKNEKDPRSKNFPDKTALPPGSRYWAFISYSHRDEQWSKWLHEGIETYKIPSSLVARPLRGGSTPRRMFPLFRDREELPGAAELGAQIRQAIEQSLYLIVICSPRAAISSWVNREVQVFKALGREDRLLCLIVDGEPDADAHAGELECFPPAVRFKVNAAGELTNEPTQPIAADARPGKDGKNNAQLKLLAGMLGVGFDQLHQRERQRKLRRRVRLTLAGVFALALVFTGYVALADLGVSIIGGEHIRTVIDRFEASCFRAIPKDIPIRRSASETRRATSGVLLRVWSEGNHFVFDSPSRPGHPKTLSVWGQSQALSGLLRSPDLTAEQLRALVKELSTTLDPEMLIQADGKKYGFLAGGVYTQAEPTLWNGTAISMALNRPGLLVGEERKRFEERLAEVQDHLTIYWDRSTGGWNTYPNQLRPEAHVTYTATLALLMLLELREANLPWKGDTALRDEMLNKTARWLITQWSSAADLPGWRGAADDEAPVSDGLTLQIYSELLRAEAHAGVTIPEPMLATIPRHLLSLGDRPLDFPSSVGRFTRAFINHNGQPLDINPGVNYLWHPWAVDSVRLWLERSQNQGGPPVQRTQMRRVLGYLVVNLGREFQVKVKTHSVPPFMASETMYVYSRIPPP